MGSLFENLFAFNDVKKNTPLKWSEFIKKTSDDIDKRLIAHAKKEGLIYVGGKCRFTVTSDEKNENILNVDAELYYKDQFKKDKNFQIYPLHTERTFSEFMLDDEETKSQLEQIKKEQFEFNVEAPQTENKTEEK